MRLIGDSGQPSSPSPTRTAIRWKPPRRRATDPSRSSGCPRRSGPFVMVLGSKRAATRSIPPRTRRACAMLPSHNRSSPCRSGARSLGTVYDGQQKYRVAGGPPRQKDHAVRALRWGLSTAGHRWEVRHTALRSGRVGQTPHRRRGGQRRRPGCAHHRHPLLVPAAEVPARASRVAHPARGEEGAWSETSSRATYYQVALRGTSGLTRLKSVKRTSAVLRALKSEAGRVVVRAVRGPSDVGQVAKGRFPRRAKVQSDFRLPGVAQVVGLLSVKKRPGGGRFSPKACGYRRWPELRNDKL